MSPVSNQREREDEGMMVGGFMGQIRKCESHITYNPID